MWRRTKIYKYQVCVCLYLVAWGAGSTLCTIYRVSTVHPWRPLKARIRYVRALRLLDLAGFAVFERFPQQHRLLSLCLHLLLQPPQSLDQLLEGGNQQPGDKVNPIKASSNLSASSKLNKGMSPRLYEKLTSELAGGS